MTPDLFETIKTALGNQFVSGGLVLGLIGAIMAAARHLPGRFGLWVASRFTVSVTVHNDDAAFEWFASWLDKHPYSRRARMLTASTVWTEDTERTLIFTPAPGNHVLWARGTLVWIVREREKTGSKKEYGRSSVNESFRIIVPGRSQEVVRALFDEAREIHQLRRKHEAHVYLAYFGEWSQIGRIGRRSLDSVILPGTVRDDLVADVQKFRDSEDWYFDLGIPYHRGYLLYGVPGSGKSSLVAAVAAKFNLNLYLINIGNKTLNDDTLVRLVNTVENNSLILLEDVDSALNLHERSGKKVKAKRDDEASGVTLSGLLNTLDGLLSKDGSLIFMTTNHRQLLDPALVRSGRCDVHLEFGNATYEQAFHLFNRFFPSESGDGLVVKADRFATAVAKAHVAMAVVQEILSTHRDDHHQAVSVAEAL